MPFFYVLGNVLPASAVWPEFGYTTRPNTKEKSVRGNIMCRSSRLVFILSVAFALVACGGQSEDAPVGSIADATNVAPAQVDTDRIAAAADEPEVWLTYGGTYDEQRHSALGQINRDTLPELGVGWVYETAKPRGAEATPIVVDGVMYVSSAWSVALILFSLTERTLPSSTSAVTS